MSDTKPASQSASPKMRLYATPAIHRLYPSKAGDAYVRWRTERWWEADPRARADARDAMEALLGCSGETHNFLELGKRYIFEMLHRDEMAFRPWLTTALPVERLNVLREAHAKGRGVVLNFMHHGQYGGVFPSISRHGIPLHIVGDKWYQSLPSKSWAALRARQHIATVLSHGVRPLIATPGAFATMCDALRAGEVVAICSDLPGSTPTTFLGRPVGAASGAARLALETGAAIVPVTARRGGKVQIVRIEDALQVDESMDVSAVLAAILRAHEPAVLRWPEALERPAKRFNFVRPEDNTKFGYPPGAYFQRYLV